MCSLSELLNSAIEAGKQHRQYVDKEAWLCPHDYLQKQTADQIWPMSRGLLTSDHQAFSACRELF